MSTLGTHLREDHERLATVAEELLNRVHTDDLGVMEEGWAKFEAELLEHLAFEEEQLLPRFEGTHAAEAAWIRQDHARLRAAIAQMGVDLELHNLREERVQAFIDGLRAHSKQEEKIFYPWADAHVEAPEGRPTQPKGHARAE
jgi:iron-sulfur cluster repair protein YtfE (RIC family)